MNSVFLPLFTPLWNKSHMAKISYFWPHVCANICFCRHKASNISTGTTGRFLECLITPCALGFSISQGMPQLQMKRWLQRRQCIKANVNLTPSAIECREEICWSTGFDTHKVFRLCWASCHKSYVDAGNLTLALFIVSFNCCAVLLTFLPARSPSHHIFLVRLNHRTRIPQSVV